jgi:hypothetical protein
MQKSDKSFLVAFVDTKNLSLYNKIMKK